VRQCNIYFSVHEPNIAFKPAILFLIGINAVSAREIACELRAVACAHHRSKSLSPRIIIGRRRGERPDPAAARKRFCGRERRFVVMNELRCKIRGDARASQRLPDSPRSIASPGQRRASCFGEACIIDITQIGTSRHDGIHIRTAVTRPATFADLSAEVGRKFATCCRISPDVMEREPLERLLIEGSRRAAWRHAPRLCHSPPRMVTSEIRHADKCDRARKMLGS